MLLESLKGFNVNNRMRDAAQFTYGKQIWEETTLKELNQSCKISFELSI